MENLIDKLTNYNLQFSGLFLDIITAILIIFVGFILGKLAGKLIRKILHEAEVDKVSKKMGVKVSAKHIISIIAEYLIYLAAIIMALNQLKLAKIVLQTLIIITTIIILIFAFMISSDLLPNLISTFIIHKRKLYNNGDYIETCGVSGKVVKFGLIETKILTKNKDEIRIPNSSIVRNKIKIKKSKH